MDINYGPLISVECPALDTVCEEESDGYASGAMILMAVEGWAEENRLPENTVAEILARAEAIAAAMLATR